MLYRLKKLVTCASLSMILGALTPMVAFGAGATVNGTVKAAWNAPDVQDTNVSSHTLTTGCVGDSLSNCAVWSKGMPPSSYKDDKCEPSNRGTDKNEGTIIMLVASKVNSRGAKFCVTQIQATNQPYNQKAWGFGCAHQQNSGSYTAYYYPTGAENECFWLCKDGYYGEECQYQNPQSCSDKSISAQTFEGFERVTSGGKDIDHNIEMFDRGTMIGYERGRDWGEEYDTVLMVTEFLSNGNGAKVAPVAVRAAKKECHRWQSGIAECSNYYYVSTPYLKKVGKDGIKDFIVCKDGYHVKDGTCVATDFCSAKETELKESKRLPCGTTQWTQFDEKQHIKVISSDETCFTYKCKGSKGFKSVTDHTCIECNGNQRREGVPGGNATDPAVNVCTKCSVGYTFNKDAPGDDYCSPAKKVPLETLLYGSVNQDTTKAQRAPARVADQCWTFTDEEEYKACVTDSVAAAQQKAQQRLAPARQE